nr:group 10 secretory phospholipase A2 isoform X4 [Oryctolagus cuniculus]
MLLLLLLLLPLPPLGPGPGRTAATPASRRSHVHRRGILDLAGTVSCVGTRSPMAYVDYGCFCGLGGHGQPRDAVDWCCHRHDCCYARAEEAGCSPKMEHYPWECVGQQVLCGASARDLEKRGRNTQARAKCTKYSRPVPRPVSGAFPTLLSQAVQ